MSKLQDQTVYQPNTFFSYLPVNKEGVQGQLFENDFAYAFNGFKEFETGQNASSYRTSNTSGTTCYVLEYYYKINDAQLANSNFSDNKDPCVTGQPSKGFVGTQTWLGGNVFLSQGCNEGDFAGGGTLSVRGDLPNDAMGTTNIELWADVQQGTLAGNRSCGNLAFSGSQKVLDWDIEVADDGVTPPDDDPTNGGGQDPPVEPPVIDTGEGDSNILIIAAVVAVIVLGIAFVSLRPKGRRKK